MTADTPPTPCLAVVMPCFNEETRVVEAIGAVLASPWTAELIVIDDGSSDATAALVAGIDDPRLRLLRQPCNLGKGAALRRGFTAVTAPFVIVQDADLEYDPSDWTALLGPLLEDRADVVFGSRFLSDRPHRVLYFWHSVGNRFLTTLSNAATNLNLSDMETCSKVFRREVLAEMDLREDRFGIEPEITAKVAAGRWRVYEVGITYRGRTYEEGKKIGWRDGFRAIWCIARYSGPGDRLARRAMPTPNPASTADADGELEQALLELEGADAYADWVLSQFESHLGGRMLEVGAGVGTMTRRLAERGEVVAVEPADVKAKVLADTFVGDPRVTVVHGSLDDVAPGPPMDAAILINVLEHIPDDVTFLAQLADRVVPGGPIMCFVPAHEWLHSRFDDAIGHQRRYRRSALAATYAGAGIDLDELHYVNAPGAVAWFLGARVLGLAPSAWSTTLYQRFVLPFVGRGRRDHEARLGQSLVAIGRRTR